MCPANPIVASKSAAKTPGATVESYLGGDTGSSMSSVRHCCCCGGGGGAGLGGETAGVSGGVGSEGALPLSLGSLPVAPF